MHFKSLSQKATAKILSRRLQQITAFEQAQRFATNYHAEDAKAVNSGRIFPDNGRASAGKIITRAHFGTIGKGRSQSPVAKNLPNRLARPNRNNQNPRRQTPNPQKRIRQTGIQNQSPRRHSRLIPSFPPPPTRVHATAGINSPQGGECCGGESRR